MKKNIILILSIVAVTVIVSVAIMNGDGDMNSSALDEHDSNAEADDAPKGPHGGRLLSEGDFGVEITIAESGIPPEFRLYGYANGQPLPPDNFSARLRLDRLGGKVDEFSFAPVGDYLRADDSVREPHSFDVAVHATYQGRSFDWTYENREGRVTIPDAIARDSGIGTAIAGPALIVEALDLTGTVQAVPANLAEVRPRFPGIVRSLRRGVGDAVRVGQVLATVENNESLRTYQLTAPIDGTIVARNAQIGQVVGEDPLFHIVDLSTVWVQLDVFGRNKDRIRAGQSVHITTMAGYETEGTIEWLSPLVAHGSQSIRARVPLPNPEGHIRPGQFVRGAVTVTESEVPLAVRTSALQSFRDFTVAFEKIGETYEVRMLDTGRSDPEHTEVLGGLSTGAEYVADNSYLIKADIEKSGASHDH